MVNNSIKINDVIFDKRSSRSINYHGKHSGKSLAGINLSTSVWKKDIQKVEDLFIREIVQVDDPFMNRSYRASLRKVSESYQEGHPFRQYVAEIRELDIPPEFTVLDIGGHQFPVLKYFKTDEKNDAIGRHVLLKLTREQFIELQNLFELPTVQIKRIEVDEEPITVCFGGGMHWSRHEEGGVEYYKQIVRFFPPDLPQSKVYIASGPIQNALARMIVALSARFEALLNELSKNTTISLEKRNELLGDDWKRLLDKNRVDQIILEIEKVADADEEFE
jgi:hypothetical protein